MYKPPVFCEDCPHVQADTEYGVTECMNSETSQSTMHPNPEDFTPGPNCVYRKMAWILNEQERLDREDIIALIQDFLGMPHPTTVGKEEREKLPTS